MTGKPKDEEKRIELTFAVPPTQPLLLMLGQKPGVAADASAYLRIAGWGCSRRSW